MEDGSRTYLLALLDFEQSTLERLRLPSTLVCLDPVLCFEDLLDRLARCVQELVRRFRDGSREQSGVNSSRPMDPRGALAEAPSAAIQHLKVVEGERGISSDRLPPCPNSTPRSSLVSKRCPAPRSAARDER